MFLYNFRLPKKKKLFLSSEDPNVKVERFSHGKQWLEFVKIYEKGTIPKYYGITDNKKIPKYLLNKVMIFQPNEEMMDNHERFITFMYYCGAHYSGGAMIIPFNSHKARKDGYEDISHEFTPYYQEAEVKNHLPAVSRFNFVPPSDNKRYPNKKFTMKPFWEHCRKERLVEPLFLLQS